MTITRHEIRRGKIPFLIWTGAIAFLLATCIFLYPEMKGQMGSIGDMFSSMGSFTAAFGMDKLNFGTLIGYYAIECGNVLGLGGAFYAALLAVAMLAKEEKDRTAEFLLTHPVSRVRVVSEKLFAVFLQVTALNIVIFLIQCPEQIRIQHRAAVAAVESLDIAVLRRMARLYIHQVDIVGLAPFLKYPGDKLRAIVATYVLGLPHSPDDLLQSPDQSGGRDGDSDLLRNGRTVEIVYYVKDTELASAFQ